MKLILLVSLGGAIGAACRYVVTSALLRAYGTSFPWGTLAVNISGSLAMGMIAALLHHRLNALSAELRLFLSVGILGGFTTFSAFSLDVVSLVERNSPVSAALYVAGSVGLSVGAVLLGILVMRAFLL
jgi:fluoride exporter